MQTVRRSCSSSVLQEAKCQSRLHVNRCCEASPGLRAHPRRKEGVWKELEEVDGQAHTCARLHGEGIGFLPHSIPQGAL